MTRLQASFPSNPQIVVVTYRGDASADLIIQVCAARGIEVFRFNTEEYPRSIGLEFDPTRPEQARLAHPKGEVSVGAAHGIWLRRPQWPVLAETVVDDLDRELAFQESLAAIGGLWRCLAARCISPADSLQAARWKLPQLQVAKALGFPVPASLVTMRMDEARRFVATGPTVVKAIDESYVAVGERSASGLVQLVEADSLDGIELAPVFLQRFVNKSADVRVTVVGHDTFAVRIVRSEGAPIDFRATPPDEALYQVTELDQGLLKKCARFMDTYGLRFGAFDFAEDIEGRLWFLECNPNGQWGWLEPPTGLQISSTLVELLLNPSSS